MVAVVALVGIWQCRIVRWKFLKEEAYGPNPVRGPVDTVSVTVAYCERNTSVMQLLQNGTTEKCSACKAQRQAQQTTVRWCENAMLAQLHWFIPTLPHWQLSLHSYLLIDDDDVCPHGS